MGLLESVGWGLAVIAGGVLAGYVLFWIYAFRNQVNIRERYESTIPKPLRHWSFYGAVGLALLSTAVYYRDSKIAILIAVPAIGNAAIWFRDARGEGA